MEMASSSIIDLWPFDRRRDLSPGVNGGVGRLNTFRYGSSDLASPDRFWIFSLGRREENFPRSICPGCYILGNGYSYPRLPSDVDQVVRLFCSDILVLYSCRCGLTNLMVARVHVALALRIKLKLWENLYWYLQVYGLISILSCLQKSTRLCHGRRKNLKTLKIY
jgi:hypothetical protein